MKISAAGLSLIREFEGFYPVPYRCPAGLWTVGYGHVLAPYESYVRITQAQAEALLRKDVRHAALSVLALVRVPLTQGQFDALVSFAFNLGSGAFERSTLRRAVNRQAHDEVPEQLLRWVYAAGRKMPGLQRRRAAEARLYAGLN